MQNKKLGMASMATLVGIIATVLAAPPASAGIWVIQAESGSIVNPFCAFDGEVMSVQGGVLFYPQSGCAADYNFLEPIALVDTITYYMTGHDGLICGQFKVTDLTTGLSANTEVDCAVGGTTVTGNFAIAPLGNPRVLAYRLTWIPADAGWVNAFVDFHTGF